MANITFKTEKATGKWRAFQSDEHKIKYGGKEIGTIEDERPHKIRLMVIKDDINKDGNTNCNWIWVTLKGNYDSIKEAKDFILANQKAILKLNLHYS